MADLDKELQKFEAELFAIESEPPKKKIKTISAPPRPASPERHLEPLPSVPPHPYHPRAREAHPPPPPPELPTPHVVPPIPPIPPVPPAPPAPPKAAPPGPPPPFVRAPSHPDPRSVAEANKRKRKTMRAAAGKVWNDDSLAEWPDNDYRIFVGDLGNECTDDNLTKAFNKYPSFVMARVVRDKHSQKSKGFGFVSLMDPDDYMRAMKEMNGKYIGNRPVKLRKSNWKDRGMTKQNKGMKLLRV